MDQTTKERAIMEFLADERNCYLMGSGTLSFAEAVELEAFDVVLYRVDEISTEDRSPRKEALENVLSALKMDGINFIYLILGDRQGVHFYYGVARNYYDKGEPELNIADIGKYILEPGIRGNFRGSKITEIRGTEKRGMLSRIAGQKHYSVLEGVPGYVKDDEKFQGVDRLVDAMLGDSFGLMIIASPVGEEGLREIRDNLYDIYAKLMPLSKQSVQDGKSTNEGTSEGETSGENVSEGTSYTKSSSESFNVSDGTTHTSGTGTSTSVTKGTSKTSGTGTSTSVTRGTGKSSGSSSNSSSTSESGQEGSSTNKSTSTSESRQEGSSTSTSEARSHTEATNKGESETEGKNSSKGSSTGRNTQRSMGSSVSSASTVELVDKKAQDWLKYLDEVIFPRLDYGMGKGVFITASFLFSDSRACLKKLENMVISLYSGETGNKIPLRAAALGDRRMDRELAFFQNLQLPCGTFPDGITDNERKAHSALSQFIPREGNFLAGNWITTNELAMVAGLPKKDVVGLELKEEVEFGLNFKSDIAEENRIGLGKLVQSGNIIDRDVYLDAANLNQHLFITGVTGSGKTTTCQNILAESGKPFLVIEPAKTEYRILREKYPDLLVFTLGKDTVAPFRLNPFQFFPHESITSRVDMIQASIEASFEMEAAIPQIIESAIYACYEDYGWNISTNKNRYYGEHAFDDGVYAFPTLGDLVRKIETVVDAQGFDARLRNDYIGSIKARLSGLLVGAKGFMLNAGRSIDFTELLSKRVVLELEEIRSATEKSLIMGFVLTNLMEAIKANYMKRLEGAGAADSPGGRLAQKNCGKRPKPEKAGAADSPGGRLAAGTDSSGEHPAAETGNADRCAHITLVEEAHRLLSRYSPGDGPNKKHGVETFSDMLAEIRKYGECLMIADQIPNKLTPEVLKNTNTKIVHRLFAEDDKEAIGNTIVLEKEQREFLSKLGTGSAVVFTQGFNKAIQVQMNKSTDTSSNKAVHDRELRESAYRFYAREYRKGIIVGAQLFKEEPSPARMEALFDLEREGAVARLIPAYVGERERGLEKQKGKIDKELARALREAVDTFGKEFMAEYLVLLRFAGRKGFPSFRGEMKEKKAVAREFVEQYAAEDIPAGNVRRFYDAFL